MKDLALVRQLARSTAALGLATMFGGAALAQTSPAVPSPPVMTDTAPLPAQHRDSLGAIVMPQSPVLAQRGQLAPLAAPVDTRSMGAGPARVLEADRVKAAGKAKRSKAKRSKGAGSQDAR
ncbi:hypothetical protein [Ramlibacter sp.]|uniref:hypothetical protein n=1 Tax=Ramlibacter sp. TaxID=1917967 RepID=UPI0017A672F0|nr:hypothetical protein [Ramlibacter sp.]MBA2675465.1 hypothetical protein [Ramlibacter sp.]